MVFTQMTQAFGEWILDDGISGCLFLTGYMYYVRYQHWHPNPACLDHHHNSFRPIDDHHPQLEGISFLDPGWPSVAGVRVFAVAGLEARG